MRMWGLPWQWRCSWATYTEGPPAGDAYSIIKTCSTTQQPKPEPPVLKTSHALGRLPHFCIRAGCVAGPLTSS